MDPKESGAQNPYRLLLHKLTGTSTQKPRLRSAANVWRKTQRKEIDAEVKKLAASKAIPRSALTATRDKAAREMFAKLPEDEQAQWAEQAKEEHEAALARWKEDNQGSCSTSPEDRQRCELCGICLLMGAHLPIGVSKDSFASPSQSLT